MRIDAEANSLFSAKRNAARADTQDFASMLAQGTTGPQNDVSKQTKGDRPDFTSMTRQELSDWINEQLRNGDMTLDESTPFLGMTIRVSAATGQPVEMATDMTRFNFIDRARDGMDFARSRFDYATVEQLQDAIAMMQSEWEADF